MKKIFIPILLLLLITLAGCGGNDLHPVQILQSGAYQIQVQTPGGVLQNGPNDIVIEVVQDGEAMAVEEGSLVFSMPAMGTMPAMQAPARLSPDPEASGLTGTVTFSMAGGWNAQIEVTTSQGPLRGSFSVQVEE